MILVSQYIFRVFATCDIHGYRLTFVPYGATHTEICQQKFGVHVFRFSVSNLIRTAHM